MINWNERTVKVDDLSPFERNPRKISESQYKKLVSSLKENGYHQRILATQDLRVIGGHQRKRALKELGINEISVLTPDRELSDEEFKRLLIQDNIPFGEFDFAMLGSDFDAKDLADWGMPEDWLKKIPQKLEDGLTDPDAVPEAPQTPVTRLGDVWLCGNHRIICGDSTQADVVSKLLGTVKPHLMVTDPPYGVEYDANWRNEAMRADGSPIAGRAIGKVMNDDRADWSEAWALFPGNIAYIWHGSLQTDVVKHSIEQHGFKARALIIWAKSHFVISRGDYHGQHEPCWYAVKGTGNWTGDRKQTTVWNIDKPQKSETGHSTQKPVECMKRPILNNSSEGQAIYEPFSGSGTTMIACEQTGRHCYAIELSPAYVDMAVERWSRFSGKSATLESTGEAFPLKVDQGVRPIGNGND